VQNNVSAEVREDGQLEAAREVETNADHTDNTIEQHGAQHNQRRDRYEERGGGQMTQAKRHGCQDVDDPEDLPIEGFVDNSICFM
jgi:hypothetical protein